MLYSLQFKPMPVVTNMLYDFLPHLRHTRDSTVQKVEHWVEKAWAVSLNMNNTWWGIIAPSTAISSIANADKETLEIDNESTNQNGQTISQVKELYGVLLEKSQNKTFKLISNQYSRTKLNG